MSYSIGEKVVPFRKSLGESLQSCTMKKAMEGKHQPFLYVSDYTPNGISYTGWKEFYTLSISKESPGGDFFAPEDFIAYETYLEQKIKRLKSEIAIIKKASNSPNTDRALMVSRARNHFRDLYPYNEYYTRGRLCRIDVIVNRRKRAVVALLKDKETGQILAREIVKCYWSDVFNADIGKIIALLRLLGEKEKAEQYYNVPDPTNPDIGDIIEHPGVQKLMRCKVVPSIMNVLNTEGTCHIGSEIAKKGRIVDDTDRISYEGL